MTEDALQVSEERFRRVFDILPVAAYTCDVGGQITYFNRVAAEVWGRSPTLNDPVERFCGSFRLYWPDGTPAPHELCWMAVALREKRAVNSEEIVIERPDGTRRSVLAHASPLWGHSGQFDGAVNILVDITERKDNNAALIKRQEQLEEAQKLAHVGHWDWDIVRNITTRSNELYRIYGVDAEKIVPSLEHFFSIIHPDDRVRVTNLVESELRTREPRDYQCRIVRPDGEIRAIQVRSDLQLDAAGRPSRLFGTVQDITERHCADELRARLAAIVDSSDDAIIGMTLDGIITSWNRGAEALFGYSVGEIVGEHVALLLPADRREEEKQILMRLNRAMHVRHYETVRRRKDGSLVDVSLTLSPIRDSENRMVGVSKISRDISARKRAQEELRNYANRLENISRRVIVAQEEERRRIARELHDEFGQALTACRIILEMAARHPAANVVSGQLAECIKNVEHLLSQVRRLSLDLRPAPLDDFGLVAALRGLVNRMGEAGGFSVDFSADPIQSRLPEAIETACFRVAQEALTNIVRHAHAHQISVELHVGRELQLVVRDDGGGFNLEAARNPGLERSSMGLLGMEERIYLVGGRLMIETALGRGTRVRAVIPLRVPPGASATTEDPK